MSATHSAYDYAERGFQAWRGRHSITAGHTSNTRTAKIRKMLAKKIRTLDVKTMHQAARLQSFIQEIEGLNILMKLGRLEQASFPRIKKECSTRGR